MSSLPPDRAASLDRVIAGTLRDLPERLGRPPTVTETEKRVEQIRAAFSHALAKELRQMNQAASTICTLPSEIIALVAAQLVFLDVLLAASICSRLRQIIVTTPSLWTEVSVIFHPDSPDSAQLNAFLMRSGKMPVSVSLKGPSNVSRRLDDLVKLPLCIFEHLDHISRLSVDFQDLDFSVADMTRPAPQLQSLTLRAPKFRYYLQHLPGRLCGGVLSNLTSVDLKGFALPTEPVEFPSVNQLQIHCMPPVDGWDTDHLQMRRIAQTFPNLARLCLGEGPFPNHPVERLHKAEGLEEVLIGEESQLAFGTCCLQLDLIPRLVALSKSPGMDLLCRSLPTTHFFKNAMEGLADDGRIISVAWPTKIIPIQTSFCENIRSVVVHIDHLRWSLDVDWPLLDSLEFDITRPSPAAIKAAFSMPAPHAEWNTPVLRSMRLVFTEDSRGRGTRVVFPSELLHFLQRFKIDPPVFAKLELIRLHLWKKSRALSALVTELIVNGQPYDERGIGGQDSMHLVPSLTDDAAMDEDTDKEGYTDYAASGANCSTLQDDSSSEDATGSDSSSGSCPSESSSNSHTSPLSSPSDSSSDSSESSLYSSDASYESARLRLKATAQSEWKLLTSEFPARKIRDLLMDS